MENPNKQTDIHLLTINPTDLVDNVNYYNEEFKIFKSRNN